MAESKVELNQRKIRNAARRGAIKGERTMRHKTWKKLTTVKPPKPRFDDLIMYASKRNTSRRIFYCPTPSGDTLCIK